ncbi:hypothetical protein BGZ83_006129 [Gryganskiella cystojenkinii]|nr:hypothetical protein BGZ83_006129 [Gryganskiella cystojenkinii]
MPSDTSINLSTSAAAAFCARILVHPLDNVKVSIQSSQGVPAGIVPRLEQILNGIRQQLQYHYQYRQQQKTGGPYRLYNHPTIRAGLYNHNDRVPVWRGIYRGVSFALIFQVPALTLFLSTYDASKHGLQYLAQSAGVSNLFQYHHIETHLLGGMMAKASGNLIWAPMNKLQSMANHPTLGPLPLTLQDAYRFAKQICTGSEGPAGLWSGYTKSFTSLLPYTMLYFATYEQCKHVARCFLSSETRDYYEILTELFSREIASSSLSPDENKRLTPGTYMMCVASAVAISSTICQTASAVRDLTWARFQSRHVASSTSVTVTEPETAYLARRSGASAMKRPVSIASLLQPQQYQQSLLSIPGSPKSPISPVSPTRSVYPSALTMVASSTSSSAPSHLRLPTFVSPQLKTLMSSTSMVASQTLSSLPWQPSQHATFATTSLMPFRSSGVHHQYLSKAPLKGYTAMSTLPAITAPPPSVAYSGGADLYTQFSLPPKNSLSLSMRNGNDMNLTMTNTNSNLTTSTATTSNSLKNSQSTLFRTIVRGLGPRILWTVPGVTLTTAGFEMFRNLAAGGGPSA